MKYKRLEDEGTLRGKLHKFNIHSIRKKGDRFAGYLKFLTGVEPQVRNASVVTPMPSWICILHKIFAMSENNSGVVCIDFRYL